MIKLKSLILEEKIEVVAYHGADVLFDTFDSKFIGSRTDPGFAGRGYYFTSDIENAKRWGKYLYHVKVKLNNPLYINGMNDFIQKSGYQQLSSGLSQIKQKEMYKKEINRITDDLINKGYDGVIWKMSNGTLQYVSYFPERQCEIVKVENLNDKA